MNRVNEGNKLRSFAACPLHQLSITLSPTNPNHFCLRPVQQIRQQDQLLKLLALNDSYFASEDGGLYFQTIQNRKLCVTHPCNKEIFSLRKYIHLRSKRKNKMIKYVASFNILIFINILYFSIFL